jgi:cytochrome c peroxidase
MNLKPSLLCLVIGSLATSVLAADLTPAELRAKAKQSFGVLPDKMPGSDQDTSARVQLGRKLYFETRLSKDNSMSCNSCHRLDEFLGGADRGPTSKGVASKFGDRNSPTTLNAGFHFAQFWDGRAANLREQAKGPVLNPIEMAMPDEAEVVSRLKADAEYPQLFARAFPGQPEKITYDNMAEAIAAFERTLITHDRFDDFQRGDDRALSVTELKGLYLVTTLGCTTCHAGPVMGGNLYMKIGLVHPYETADLGRQKITNDDSDNRKFKVPSLRNVAITGPYFHDGKITSLKEAVTKMAYHQLDKQLTDQESETIVAFLKSLTDKPRVVVE